MLDREKEMRLAYERVSAVIGYFTFSFEQEQQ